MKIQMTKLCLTVFALTMILAISDNAEILLDQSDYNLDVPGFINAYAPGPMGMQTFSVNDITVGENGWVIQSITSYVNALGGYDDLVNSGYLNIFPKTGPMPVDGVDVPTIDVVVDLTVTFISGNDFAVTADNLNLELGAGEYWIGVTPDISNGADYGVHLASYTYVGDATATLGLWGDPAWQTPNPGFDAAVLIMGDAPVAVEGLSWGSVKALYR